MQSWLFFGLIATVVYDDNCRPFDWETLRDGRVISTKNLSCILNDWREWETKEENRPGQTLRLIRAQLALDVARRVIKNHSREFVPKGPTQLDQNLALTLMVLGETLTNAKAKIIQEVGFKARDWYGDATIGWGSPSAVLEKMDDWCPRTIKLLRSQLRDNATALLSVYVSHRGHVSKGHKESGCTKVECFRKSEVKQNPGKYATQHHPDCLHGGIDHPCHPELGQCRQNGAEATKEQEEDEDRGLPTCHTPCVDMIGVDNIKKVVDIIEADKVPLFVFNERTSMRDPIQLTVKESNLSEDYATISHVWSDGYGNPDKNKLWKCQLDYLWELLREAQSQRNRQKMGEERHNPTPLPFWMDTLAIPVEKEFKDTRKKAIAQIYKVYSRARYTIVIDNGLNNMSWTDKDYTTTAMRILASGWMRRLWTLQEAYLSRKLLFAFRRWDKGDNKNIPLVDLDEIEELYIDVNEKLVSSLPANARSYYHNMLGQDRKARIHGLTSTNSVGLVASVWKAAQWRTTSKREHETLALATLLNLEYQNTSFAGGQILKDHERDTKLKEYMKDFWEVLEENSPGAIPPGIIFLPGDRIQMKGFGWAPLTWMEAGGVDHPDPISVISKSAKLEPLKGGLLVEFPGFLLHCQDRNAILGFTNGKGFWFPSDSSLSEWYHVERADNKEFSTKKGVVYEERAEQLAIILSRPRPREMAEIGLLVEVYEIREQRELGKDSGKRIFKVFIIGRVTVRRETDTRDEQKARKDEIIQSRKETYHKRIICGEALEDDQQWYVDSRTGSDGEMDETSKIPTEAASEVNVVVSEGRVKPYPARHAMDREVPADESGDGSTSVGGTETPELAQSTHTVATVASSSKNIPPPQATAAEDLLTEKSTTFGYTNDVSQIENLKKTRTGFTKSSWGVGGGVKKSLERARTFFSA
ncbi:hypothetical protein BKA63DRAFT_173216 [Paraphoma chrysanthemicola]|nr:hypothetical protein BKA63DRAFT_173216 [Paraphoma chrysanthemicola]